MLKIDFINVGDGDAILIRDIHGRECFTMLVDCGRQLIEFREGSKRRYAIDYLAQEDIRRIDLLVLSHMHIDHFGGCFLLMDQMDIGRVITGYIPGMETRRRRLAPPGSPKTVISLYEDLNLYADLTAALQSKGIPVEQARQAGVAALTERLAMDVRLPPRARMERQRSMFDGILAGGAYAVEDMAAVSKDRNITSLVLTLSYAGRRILLTGDAYAACLEEAGLPCCDIVKLPHHGDAKSMTEGLLKMLTPAYGVVSCQNDSGAKLRPAQEVVALMGKHGCRLICTENGPVGELAPSTRDGVRFEISESGRIQLKGEG